LSADAGADSLALALVVGAGVGEAGTDSNAGDVAVADADSEYEPDALAEVNEADSAEPLKLLALEVISTEELAEAEPVGTALVDT
jgi:hypothetical protein